MHGAKADTESPILAGEHGLLMDHHRRQLHARGLTDATIAAAGLYSEANEKRLNSILGWKGGGKKLGCVLAIPYVDCDGRNGYVRVRPDAPRTDTKGKPVKYESPKNQPNQVYIPPGARDRLDDPGAELLITEGEFKALAATQHDFRCLGLPGVYAWKKTGEAALIPQLARINWQGRNVFVVFDSDLETNAKVAKALQWLCHHLKQAGANVKVAYLPGRDDGAKVGLDDYLLSHGPAELRKLLDAAEEPTELLGEVAKEHSEAADPATEAKKLLDLSKIDGVPRLLFWRGSFWFWTAGCYRELQNSEVEGIATRHLNEHFFKVGRSVVGNVTMQTRAQSFLPSYKNPPTWIDGAGGDWLNYRGEDLLVAKNGIVHLPTLAIQPATPQLFCTSALDYDFADDAAEPAKWLEFLNQLWGDDPQSIQCLREWMGYSLTADTRQQKMLLLLGPRRSGKGTIARVWRSLVGEVNVCGPTLASLQTNFGLWPLLGRTLAIISDARLSGRADQAAIVERLLSISGEDAQTIDRKNLEPITTKLLTRFVIISNELPRLSDPSGALAGRMILLRLSESFYGREDIGLSDQLIAERAGILRWAIAGWRSLRERGRFEQPAAADELREQMEDLASPIGAFVRECCQCDPILTCKVSDIYAAWCWWCEQRGNKHPGDDALFGRNLSAAVTALRRGQRRDGDDRYRVYHGIDIYDHVRQASAVVDLTQFR